MRTELLNKCNLFVENRDAIKFGMPWNNAYLYPICSSIFTRASQKVDITKLKFCYRLIKSKTGIFSDFRGLGRLVIASFLAVDEQPEQLLEQILHTYDLLRQDFRRSQYLPVCATLLTASVTSDMQMNVIIRKAKEIYDGVKAQHPFITCAEDSSMVALLALSDLSSSQIIKEVETCFQTLKPHFFSSNAVQAISFVLALSLDPAKTKCEMALSYYKGLQEEKCKYGSGVELATLGVLVLQNLNQKEMIAEISEINEYLLRSKGFGSFGVGRSQRIMYASMLMVMAEDQENTENLYTTTAAAVNTAITVAQQVALSAAIAASAAGASAGT